MAVALVATLVLVLVNGARGSTSPDSGLEKRTTKDNNRDGVPAAVLYALVSALSTARGDARHSDAVYHLRLVGRGRPVLDRVRVSRLPLPAAPDPHGGGDHTTPAAIGPARLTSEHRHRHGAEDELYPATGGQRSSHGTVPDSGGRPRAAGGEAKLSAPDRASPQTEYSAGQMYFSPRMLFVGSVDRAEDTDTTYGSRAGHVGTGQHGSGSSTTAHKAGHRQSSRLRGPAGDHRKESDPADPSQQHRRLPRTVRQSYYQDRDHSARYESRYRADPESPARYGGDEPGCPLTEQDPDGDCIKGEAERDYPTLETIPRTAFSCRGRPAGFYADVETRCQVWHYCTATHVQQSFLCNRGTVFNQQHLVCDWWYSVECRHSDAFHYVNNRLYSAEEQTGWGQRHRGPWADEGSRDRAQSSFGREGQSYRYSGQQLEWGTRDFEREARERDAREQEAKKREAKEREAWEREARERETREREARERDIREQEMREREIRKREEREREAREREIREREAREREIREQETREREIREREARAREIREQEIREREIKEREAREREIKEREAREQEVPEQRTPDSLRKQQTADIKEIRPQSSRPTRPPDSHRSHHRPPITGSRRIRPTRRRPVSGRPRYNQYGRYRDGAGRRGRWVAVPRTYTAAGCLLGTRRPSGTRGSTPRPHIAHLGTPVPAGRATQARRPHTTGDGYTAGTTTQPSGRVTTSYETSTSGSYGSTTRRPSGTTTPKPYSSAAPRPYSGSALEPYDNATPKPGSSTAPLPYSGGTPQPYRVPSIRSFGRTTPSERYRLAPPARKYNTPLPRNHRGTSTSPPNGGPSSLRPHGVPTRPYRGTFPSRRYRIAYPNRARNYRGTPAKRLQNSLKAANTNTQSLKFSEKRTGNPTSKSRTFNNLAHTPRSDSDAVSYRPRPSERPADSIFTAQPNRSKPRTRPYDSSPSSSPYDSSSSSSPYDSKPLLRPYDPSPSSRPHDTSPYPRPYDSSPYPRPHETGASPHPYDPSPSPHPDASNSSLHPHDSKPSTRPYDYSPSSRPDESSPSSQRTSPYDATTEWSETDSSAAPWPVTPLPAPPTESVVTETAHPHTSPALYHAEQTERPLDSPSAERSPTAGQYSVPVPQNSEALTPEQQKYGVTYQQRAPELQPTGENMLQPDVTEQADYAVDGGSVFPQHFLDAEEDRRALKFNDIDSISRSHEKLRTVTAHAKKYHPLHSESKKPFSLQLDKYTIPAPTDLHATDPQELPPPSHPEVSHATDKPPAAQGHTERPADGSPVGPGGAYFSPTSSVQQRSHTEQGPTRGTLPRRRIKVRRRLRKVVRRRPVGGRTGTEPKSGQLNNDEKTGKESKQPVGRGGTEEQGRRKEKSKDMTDKYTQAREERMRTKQEKMRLMLMKAKEQRRLLQKEKTRRARQEEAHKTRRGERPRAGRPQGRRRSRQRVESQPDPPSPTASTTSTTTGRTRYTFPPYRPSRHSATQPDQLAFGARIGKRKRYGG